METKKAEYISSQSKSLVALSRKKTNLKNRLKKDLSPKMFQTVSCDLDHTMMEISKCRERIGYVLGFLQIKDLRAEYRPNNWQVYEGVADELMNINFD
jgi:hypothetical protein